LRLRTEDNTISIETIQDNVGLAFCMSAYETVMMLKKLSGLYANYMAYNDIAGIRQVQFTKELDYKQVLEGYYGKNF